MKVFFKMELPKIGKQCAQSECNQLDFLPLQCKCGKTFCSEHFYLHVQACETSKIVTDDELTKIGQLFICSSEGCSEKSIIPLICEKCGKHFCVKHRHLTECEPTDADTLAKEREKYAKPVRMFNEAKAVVDQEVEKKIDDAKKKTKSREMASKLQLMKIKNKATGLKSIPVANRIYFNVFHSEKATPIFVSSQWSVGRAIDAIAQEMNLQNNNNKSTEKKLRLFKKCDNQIISQNVSSVLKSLLESKFILDGDSLVIEYVDDDCVKL